MFLIWESEVSCGLPGCFCLGLGRLVTHVWGHIRTLQGCKAPSRKRCLVSDIWMPPRGALGSVLAGTRARQYTPTWWMLSMAWKHIVFLVKFEIHLLFYKHVNSKINQIKTKNIEDLEDTAHPLEAVFLWGVWPLLCHHDDPLVVQYRHRKHCDPGEQSNTVTNWLSCSTRSANFHIFHAASSFTFPCTQTSWAPRPALWQLHHQRYVSAHWRPSVHPSFPQQTQGCPG